MSEENKIYAVCVCMTKQKENNVLNIMNVIYQINIKTPDEAMGAAIVKAMKAQPEHSVFHVTWIEIED